MPALKPLDKTFRTKRRLAAGALPLPLRGK